MPESGKPDSGDKPGRDAKTTAEGFRMTLLILTGDVNLMKVTDPDAPCRIVGEELRRADLVFSNLECLLYETPPGHSDSNEGFFVDPQVGSAALKRAGIAVAGIANNVHYGEAAIASSIACLD